MAALAVTASPAPARSRPGHRHRGAAAPVVIPVYSGELYGPLFQYRGYVRGLLTALEGQTATLTADIDAGNLAAAESAWLAAHLTWLRIGQDDGAYGAFGQLGRQIDGTAAGLVRGTADPCFTGFHRVELDLWTDGNLPAAATDAARLQSLVTTLAARNLAKELPTSVTGLANWTLRAHEILEDALRDSLTADDDYGSHTDLASITADVAGTREMLSLLAPLLNPRAPSLVGRARRQLVALDAAVGAAPQGVAIAALPLGARERIDAATGAVLETLAPVPLLLKPLNDTT